MHKQVHRPGDAFATQGEPQPALNPTLGYIMPDLWGYKHSSTPGNTHTPGIDTGSWDGMPEVAKSTNSNKTPQTVVPSGSYIYKGLCGGQGLRPGQCMEGCTRVPPVRIGKEGLQKVMVK